MRILVAEDDPRLLKSLVHILKINNYSADGVSNGNVPECKDGDIPAGGRAGCRRR